MISGAINGLLIPGQAWCRNVTFSGDAVSLAFTIAIRGSVGVSTD